MLARVVIVGSAGGLDPLTYAIPQALEGRISRGQRVLVPLRARRLTGIVVETGDNLESGGAAPKAILEMLEPQPLFDRAHLELIEFLASYYMTPLGEAYRNVIPAGARVESRRTFRLGAPPGPLALAAMTLLEHAILEALAKRALALRQLLGLGDRREVESALGRLESDGFIERHDGTRGRHRGGSVSIVRLLDGAGASPKLRGAKQREIVRVLGESGNAITLNQLEAAIPRARVAVLAMADRGLVELTASHLDPFRSPREDGQSPDGDGSADDAVTLEHGPELTWEQAAAVDTMRPAVREKKFETFLLWGITASGKTEVYLRLAAAALAAERQVLVLVPEIALADQVVRAFRRRFGALVGIAHSGQNVVERWTSWMAALGGRARIMIGPRSVVFAPLHDPGLIVVDEEHDAAYKAEERIRYNARDLAVVLGRFSGCPVVLGSATPSAESYANARRGRYRMLRLSRRVGERELAEVEIVDLRERPPLINADAVAESARIANGQDSASARHAADPAGDSESAKNGAVPLSERLVTALRQNLAAGGQSVIFLNRRGYHNFLQCHLCGNVIACPNCSVSQTFHLHDRSLRCHYCGFSSPAPDRCPECRGHGLEGQGFGTERLLHALATILPSARFARMDSDTSGRRGARSAMLDALGRGEIDVLVGTQMITKGFDFPGVTLVGVVLADLALNMPDFRSAERTFQLLTQVAGRAGRGDKPGRVLIQTYAPFHYSIRAARDQDYARFMRRELELRRELMYPPFARIAMVRVEGQAGPRVSEVAARVAASLARFAKPDALRVLGPAPAPIERIKQRYRWQVMVKSAGIGEMRAALAAMRAETALLAETHGVHVGIDIDAVNML